MERNRTRAVVSRSWMILVPFAFYIFFWVMDGAVICADTETYINMEYSREPMYPMLLALFRAVFGDAYLSVVALFQSMLAALVTTVVTDYISEEYKLNPLFSVAVMIMMLAPSLLCRFAAGRASMYSNSILTEGITLGLYVLFIRLLLEYVLSDRGVNFYKLIILLVVLISTRKQMYVLLALFLFCLLIKGIVISVDCNLSMMDAGKKLKSTIARLGKSLITCLIVATVVLSFVKVIDCTYNYILRGSFSSHTEDNRFVTTVAMYTADREYVQYIEPEYQDIFLEIYDECDANGYLMNAQPEGWFDQATHFADHYDLIQLDTMEHILERRVDDITWEKDDLLKGDKMDIVRSSFNKSLIPHEIDRLMHVFFNNFLVGLVTTVAQRTHLLCAYSVLVYLFYVALLAILAIKSIKGYAVARKALVAGSVVALSILMNVSLVAAVIFAQTRYTIYNMSLFYIAGIVMFAALIRGDKVKGI